MKKFMLSLLILSLLLCGCGNSTTDDSKQNGSAQGNQNQQEVSNNTSAVILQITINPVFNIHLDDNDNVSEIFCLNDDANKLFSDMDVVGMAYQEAMPVILNKAYEMEFITTDSTEITMEIIVQGDIDEAQMEELKSSLKTPITEFQEEKGLVLEVNDADILDGVRVEKTYGFDEKGQIGDSIRYFDSNGTLIRYMDFYNDYYQCSKYNTNGVLIEMIGDNSVNYFEEYYDEDGNITKEFILSHQDGVHTECVYYKNGGVKYYIWDYPDGRHSEQHFYENGNTYKIIDDGYYQEFYENGNTKCVIQDLPEGHVEQFFYENGNRQKHIFDGVDGTHYEERYDENGNLIEE